MRTIKFRARTKYKLRDPEGNFCYAMLYGSLSCRGGNCFYIVQYNADYTGQARQCFVEVDPDTIGQYTGLTDKNGKEIYEDDIIQQRDVKVIVEYYRGAFGYTRLIQHRVRIAPGASNVVQEPVFIPFIGSDDNSNALMFPDGTVFDTDYCEVIGNIHDNPELIEKGGNK